MEAQGGELCQPERLCLVPARAQLSVELPHQFEGGAIVHLPERGDHAGGPGIDEGPGEPSELIAVGQGAQRRLAGGEDNQGGVQVQPEDHLDLQAAVRPGGRGQQER